MSDRNVIYVGRKPVMSYVLAVMNCFNQRGLDEVFLRARGRAISTSVDVAEVTSRILKEDLEVGVNIGTEQLPRDEGGTRNVSTMEITITRSSKEEGEGEESAVPAEAPKSTPAGEPDEPATVEEPSPEEETSSEPKPEEEAPEEEKR